MLTIIIIIINNIIKLVKYSVVQSNETINQNKLTFFPLPSPTPTLTLIACPIAAILLASSPCPRPCTEEEEEVSLSPANGT